VSEGPPAVGAEPDPLIGRTIAGKFVIERLVGAGSMGAVYRAQQVALDRAVAVKVIRGGVTPDKTAAARFQLEAKAASRLDHPNVIHVFDYGQEPDGLLYIAMEFLDCRDLATVSEEEWPLSHARLVDILSQTLSALAEAHDSGVLHRDLKPENILLVRRKADDGTPIDLVKVCDFGIAKLTKGARATPPDLAPPDPAPEGRPLTTGGLVLGTPEYMSPEQARGETYDARSDLYSVGVILYQLLARRRPFEAKTPIEVVFKVMHAEPAPLGADGPTAAPGLDAICLKAMSRRPEDRYPSAGEMRAALRAATPVGSDPAPLVEPDRVAARDEPLAPPPPPDRAAKKPAWLRLALSFGALLFAVAVALFVLRRETAPTSAVSPPAAHAPSSPLEPSTTDTKPARSAPPSGLPALAATASNAATERPIPRELRRGTVRSVAGEGDASAPAMAPPEPAPLASSPRVGVSSERALGEARPPAALPAPEGAGPVSTSVDGRAARVDLGSVRTNNASATKGSVTRALRPLLTRFNACYRDALAQGSVNAGAIVAGLHLESDEAGYVTVARLSGDVPPPAGTCIETASRSVRIEVDTGTANADVTLTFKP
jgi:serine/threonine-protein kinase